MSSQSSPETPLSASSSTLPVDPALEPSLKERIAEQLRLHDAVRAALPGVDTPYFAHMRIRTGGRVRDVLLGPRSVSERGVLIIDWQSAPLAEVFFECSEGDEYEVEVGEQVLTGELLQRNVVTFERGEPVEVATPRATLSCRGTGVWADVLRDSGPLIALRPASARKQRSSSVHVELDAAQTRAVRMAAGRPMLILGEAGCGKTTVALHRLAHLARDTDQDRFRAVVLVPSEGLRRFTRAMLEHLGLFRVEVWLYDRWAAEQARAAFVQIPRRESEDATAGVIRFKRHPALRAALRVLAGRPAPGRGKGKGKGKGKLGTGRRDLLELFGDRELLDLVRETTGGAMSVRMLDEVIVHTKIQFGRTAEAAFAHVDADRLQALDGRALDDGTPTQDANTVDVEDYAVLFELDRMRSRRAGQGVPPVPRVYDCVVVDEAQELAPLELALIGRSLTRGGTLVVAGDDAQQVDDSAGFSDWRTTMAELGAAEHDQVTLQVSYRCPPEVTALAHAVREGRTSSLAELTAAQSPALRVMRFANEFSLATALIDSLRGLHADDPWATAAVICRTPDSARRWARLLDRGVDVRLALAGDFEFEAGINVTCVTEVKGLEFDYVIVPDASLAVYPGDSRSRNALYVAMTRPVHRLVIASVGTFTPLIAQP